MDERIIRKKLENLRSRAVEAATPIIGWRYRLADNLAAGEYQDVDGWAQMSTPAYLPAGKTIFMQAQVHVPSTIPLHNTYLSFGVADLEGLLRIDGQPYAGIDTYHLRVPVPRRGQIKLEIEFMSMPSLWAQPELADKRSIFQGAQLVTVKRSLEAFCYDAQFAYETARMVEEPRRKALLAEAVEAALLAVDLTLPLPRLEAEVARARRILSKELSAIAPDPEAGCIFATGHTHIDTAWLWPVRETVRKCSRTFSTACRLMERFPNFYFSCSQPQLYQYTKDYFPSLYRQIRKWVQAGRWETTGAMWVEADCNITSGESLIRQMLHRIEFFQQEFGTRPRACWLPDVFGYPASLPEILAACGVSYFYTYKLHWQATNRFPNHLFRWRGLDGTEILAHVVNHVGGYNNLVTPEHLQRGWQMYVQKAEYPEVIFPFGYGDGGGGVTEEMMEMYQRAEGQFPGLPAVRTGPATQYFADVEAAAPQLPVWNGELYVETHRGTYTTQSALKRANRRSELLLCDAEIFGSLAQTQGASPDWPALRQAWQTILLHQFHDILPGSSVPVVYEDALADHTTLQAAVGAFRDRSLAALAPPSARKGTEAVCVFNSLSWPRHDVFLADMPDRKGDISVQAADGRIIPTQVVARARGRMQFLLQPGEVPAMGYATFRLLDESANAESTLSVSTRTIENRYFRISLNASGGITRLHDKINRREVLAQGEVGNDLQLLQDGPEGEDAWNVHETIDKRRYPFEGATTVRVMEQGPVRGMVRVRRVHRASVIEQDIVIYAGLGRIDFVTRVDWQERNVMLKVAFPVAIRSTRATYEVQFGACERPTHRNTSWDRQKFEVPGQRWVDLSEPGYGVSLLNDCDSDAGGYCQ